MICANIREPAEGLEAFAHSYVGHENFDLLLSVGKYVGEAIARFLIVFSILYYGRIPFFELFSSGNLVISGYLTLLIQSAIMSSCPCEETNS